METRDHHKNGHIITITKKRINLKLQIMKLKLLFYINCLTIVFSTAIAQNVSGKKVETKFLRPSMTNLFAKGNSNEANTIIAAGAKLAPEMRFDNHNISNSVLVFNFGPAPVKIGRAHV